MKKPQIIIGVTPTDYDGCVNLGEHIYEKMLGNIYFPSPVPDLPTVRILIDRVVDLKTRWGNVHNRGSHADSLGLQANNLALRNNLIALGKFVSSRAQTLAGNDYQAMTEIMTSSGFTLKQPRTPVGRLEAVQDLRRVFARNLSFNQAKVRWKRPANAKKGNVMSYTLYQGTSPSFASASYVTTLSRTTYIVTGKSKALEKIYIFIVANGTAGQGLPSEGLQIVLVPA